MKALGRSLHFFEEHPHNPDNLDLLYILASSNSEKVMLREKLNLFRISPISWGVKFLKEPKHMQMMESLFLNLFLTLGKGPAFLPTSSVPASQHRAALLGTTLFSQICWEKRTEKLKTTNWQEL